MIGDAPAFYYHTGLSAITVPNEPPEVLPGVAVRYGATYLVLDQNRPRPLTALYEGRESLPQIQLIQRFENDVVLYQFEGLTP
jgi:hypothetical protein